MITSLQNNTHVNEKSNASVAKQAARHGNIHIVELQWLLDSISSSTQMPELAYVLAVPDDEPDADEHVAKKPKLAAAPPPELKSAFDSLDKRLSPTKAQETQKAKSSFTSVPVDKALNLSST